MFKSAFALNPRSATASDGFEEEDEFSEVEQETEVNSRQRGSNEGSFHLWSIVVGRSRNELGSLLVGH